MTTAQCAQSKRVALLMMYNVHNAKGLLQLLYNAEAEEYRVEG